MPSSKRLTLNFSEKPAAGPCQLIQVCRAVTVECTLPGSGWILELRRVGGSQSSDSGLNPEVYTPVVYIQYKPSTAQEPKM